jgi:hypothetical protein
MAVLWRVWVDRASVVLVFFYSIVALEESQQFLVVWHVLRVQPLQLMSDALSVTKEPGSTVEHLPRFLV